MIVHQSSRMRLSGLTFTVLEDVILGGDPNALTGIPPGSPALLTPLIAKPKIISTIADGSVNPIQGRWRAWILAALIRRGEAQALSYSTKALEDVEALQRRLVRLFTDGGLPHKLLDEQR